MISRTQMWQRNYQRRPYLADATDKELSDRLRYIVENISTLTPEGRTGFLPPEPYGQYWMELQTHVMEAYKARNGAPPPMFLKGAKVPQPTYPLAPAAFLALKGINLPPEGSYLVRLGMRQYMSDLFEYGRIRIGNAKGYSDPSLNAAICDDELKLSRFALRNEVKIEHIDEETGKSKGLIEPIGNVIYTSESNTDFYVYCTSQTLDLRLFSDFAYDACVIIREPEEFMTRLFKAVEKHLSGWNASCRSVFYYDPYNNEPDDMSVFFSKHHRYWYQREYRFGWVPLLDQMKDALEPIYVELGSLKDIAELIVLESG